MLQKNDVIQLEIQSVTNEGSGVGRHEGMAVFVPMTAAGELVQVKIVKVLKNYCYGIVEQVLRPSEQRLGPDCPVFLLSFLMKVLSASPVNPVGSTNLSGS